MKLLFATQRSLRAPAPRGVVPSRFSRTSPSSLHRRRERSLHVPQTLKEKDILEVEKSKSEAIVEDAIAFLRKDLQHLFDDQGIDASRYDDVVDFQDPVSSYSSINGYLFNIRMLKNVFSPEFTLHDLRQTDEYEITSRWTMQMAFTPASRTPLKNIWNPKLTFTGVSIYGLNPENGKINKHIDLWDAVDNHQFPSLEGFIHVFSQLLDVTRTPDLETPNYVVLKKTSTYEIRRYQPFLVAETKMSGGKGMTEVNPASAAGGSAFNQLAGYIFGNNIQKEKMEMTTPVFTDTTGNMQFVLGSKFKDVAELPSPDMKSIDTKQMTGGLFACSSFNGAALEAQVTAEHGKLEKTMIKDKLAPSAEWILARSNDPFTNPLCQKKRDSDSD